MGKRARGEKGREPRPCRALSVPFVVAPPSGCRIRTRLHLSPADVVVLRAVGEHLGALAGADLAAAAERAGADEAGRALVTKARLIVQEKAITPASAKPFAEADRLLTQGRYGTAVEKLTAAYRAG